MNDDYVKRSDVHKVFQPKYAPAINRTFAAMIDSVPASGERNGDGQIEELYRAIEALRRQNEELQASLARAEAAAVAPESAGSALPVEPPEEDPWAAFDEPPEEEA